MHSYRRRIRFTLAIDRILVLETGASVYVCVGVKFDIKRWRLPPLWVNFLLAVRSFYAEVPEYSALTMQVCTEGNRDA